MRYVLRGALYAVGAVVGLFVLWIAWVFFSTAIFGP